MTVGLVVILVISGLLAASAVGALAWAVATGQMADFAEGADSIFDDDEPSGVGCDEFPGPRSDLSRPDSSSGEAT